MVRAPLQVDDRVVLKSAARSRIAILLARHPYRDLLLDHTWQIIGTQEQAGQQLLVIEPYAWEEQGARLLAHDADLDPV